MDLSQTPQPFSLNSLIYIQQNASAINQVAEELGVPAEAIAGSIEREMTRTDDSSLIQTREALATDILDLYTLSYGGLRDPQSDFASFYQAATALPNSVLEDPSKTLRLTNPAMIDTGPGQIQLGTALGALNAYYNANPDSDPLSLDKYQGNTTLLIQDLQQNPNTIAAITGLIVQQGQDWFINHMTSETWDALSSQDQTALLVTYYTHGLQWMNDPTKDSSLNSDGTYTPNFTNNPDPVTTYYLAANNPTNTTAALNGQFVTTTTTTDNGATVTKTLTDADTGETLQQVIVTNGNTVTTTWSDNNVAYQTDEKIHLPAVAP